MLEEYQTRAKAWFRELRDLLCAEFEALEDVHGAHSAARAGKFTRKNWEREGGGGGEISLLKGGVFEKAGVNISTVMGELPDSLKKDMKHAEGFNSFWASGISVVVHPLSPHVPAVHMNTRMIVLGNAKHWFGGGADLTPVRENAHDTKEFHAALRQCCDHFSPDYYANYKKACDEYFYLKHRNEPRGVGGIFYDYLNSGNTEHDFLFTRSVGETFLSAYPAIVRRHMQRPWEPHEREEQLIKRGRYVEFNLLYDRGTRFGLMTGGNPEAILMSLPPEVKWP